MYYQYDKAQKREWVYIHLFIYIICDIEQKFLKLNQVNNMFSELHTYNYASYLWTIVIIVSVWQL